MKQKHYVPTPNQNQPNLQFIRNSYLAASQAMRNGITRRKKQSLPCGFLLFLWRIPQNTVYAQPTLVIRLGGALQQLQRPWPRRAAFRRRRGRGVDRVGVLSEGGVVSKCSDTKGNGCVSNFNVAHIVYPFGLATSKRESDTCKA